MKKNYVNIALDVLIVVGFVLGIISALLTPNAVTLIWVIAAAAWFGLFRSAEKELLNAYEGSALKDRAYDRLRNCLRETQETLRVTRSELGQERETSEKLREEVARLSEKKKE